MAVSLIEAQKVAPNQLTAGVIQVFLESHPIMERLVFENTVKGWLYAQEGTLPGIAFRGVNESYTESAGVVNPAFDPLVIAGGDIDVDNYIIRNHGPQVRASHVAMKLKALAHTIAHKIVKGDQASDPREFYGLQARLTGNQKISAGSTSGGTALSLAKLDQLIGAVDGANMLIMSQAMKRRLATASRNSSIGGQIQMTLNQFGQMITTYNGIPIIEADPNGALYASLAFDEAASSGSATGTSIYAVNMSPGMCFMIQNPSGMIAKDLGEQDSKPVSRTRLEWDIGLVLAHPRAAARLWSIGDLAVTA